MRALSLAARGHTLLDVDIADPTHVDSVARTAIVSQHAALEAAWRKERHYCGRPQGDTFIPIAIETRDALLSHTYEFLRDCARRAFSDHGGSFPSTSVLVTWFRQRTAVTLQHAQARAIHARSARLEATSSSLFALPSCAIISPRDLMAIAGFS